MVQILENEMITKQQILKAEGEELSKLALQTMLNQIIDRYGRLDILIQAGGVSPRDALLEMDEWDWRRTLDANLTGPFLLMQSAGRIMREQGGGLIVSLVHLDEERGAAAAGKKGLLALTQAAGAEFGTHNIHVNALSNNPAEGESLPGFPKKPVDLILFLCSADSPAVNGRIIHFDPGG